MRIPNIILPRFRIIFFYERKNEYSSSELYTKEDLFTVHEVQEKPFDHHVTNGHHNDIPGIADPLAKPFEEAIGRVLPVNKPTRHVDQYGIHTDHFKIECPFFIASYINNVIKNRQ